MIDFDKLAGLATPRARSRAAGPATDDQILALQEAVGPLGSIKELLKWQNGSTSDSWLGPGFWFLMSTSQISRFFAEWSDVEVQVNILAESSSQEHSGPWPRDWIPFATWNGDVYLVVEASGGVMIVDVGGGRGRLIASSLESFFDEVVKLRSEGSELDVDELLGV